MRLTAALLPKDRSARRLTALRSDDCFRAGFGAGFVDYYAHIKQAELARFPRSRAGSPMRHAWEQKRIFGSVLTLAPWYESTMPYATTADNVKLYYEEVRAEARRSCSCMNSPPTIAAGSRRCANSASAIAASPIRRAAIRRPTCRPTRRLTATSMSCAIASRCSIISKIDKAHLIGLSMGGYTSPAGRAQSSGRVRSLVLAGTGSGSERWYTDDFHKHSRATRRSVRARRAPPPSPQRYGMGPSRIPFDDQGPARLCRIHRAARRARRARLRPIPRAAFRARGRRSTISKTASANSRPRR